MKWKAIKVAHNGYDKYIRGYIGEFLKWKFEPSKEGDYFYIEALEDNTYISIYDGSSSSKLYSNMSKFEYSFNKIKWYKLSKLPLKGGKFYFEKECDRIYLRNISGSIANTSSSGGRFFPTYESTPFKIGGDLHTVMFKYTDKVDTLGNFAFTNLFNNSYVADASDLILPATTVGRRTYSSMFYNSKKLKYAPKVLSAINFSGDECYSKMFSLCSSLVNAPELPATTLTEQCYFDMFRSCSSLTKAPKILPATTLAPNCYQNMFYSCSSLVTAPELPATELYSMCYYSMFYNCYALVEAPKLPATTLAASCYYGMFYNCPSLNKVVCLATDISATSCTNNWVTWVSSTGTFIKHPDMNGWSTGNNGIPNGWTVENYTE